jgi:hypothetical protein
MGGGFCGECSEKAREKDKDKEVLCVTEAAPMIILKKDQGAMSSGSRR